MRNMETNVVSSNNLMRNVDLPSTQDTTIPENLKYTNGKFVHALIKRYALLATSTSCGSHSHNGHNYGLRSQNFDVSRNHHPMECGRIMAKSTDSPNVHFSGNPNSSSNCSASSTIKPDDKHHLINGAVNKTYSLHAVSSNRPKHSQNGLKMPTACKSHIASKSTVSAICLMFENQIFNKKSHLEKNSRGFTVAPTRNDDSNKNSLKNKQFSMAANTDGNSANTSEDPDASDNMAKSKICVCRGDSNLQVNINKVNDGKISDIIEVNESSEREISDTNEIESRGNQSDNSSDEPGRNFDIDEIKMDADHVPRYDPRLSKKTVSFDDEVQTFEYSSYEEQWESDNDICGNYDQNNWSYFDNDYQDNQASHSNAYERFQSSITYYDEEESSEDSDDNLNCSLFYRVSQDQPMISRTCNTEQNRCLLDNRFRLIDCSDGSTASSPSSSSALPSKLISQMGSSSLPSSQQSPENVKLLPSKASLAQFDELFQFSCSSSTDDTQSEDEDSDPACSYDENNARTVKAPITVGRNV